jgi:GNAT superfamily N-acetyltransferase
MLVIRNCTIQEISESSNIDELLNEYAAESAIKDLPHPNAKVKSYQSLEKAGAIHAFGAFLDNTLVGFITVLSPVLPHYDLRIAVAESFFVAKAYRKTGAGLRLLRAAEVHSADIGASGLLVSAPTGGNLAEVLPHVGYSDTNRVFFKKVENEKYCQY